MPELVQTFMAVLLSTLDSIPCLLHGVDSLLLLLRGYSIQIAENPMLNSIRTYEKLNCKMSKNTGIVLLNCVNRCYDV